MPTAPITSWMQYLDPLSVTGPIFDKEMRVASRRKRTYVFRFVFAVMLMMIVGLTWLSMSIQYLSNSNSLALQASRMSEIGRFIILTTTWFQFAAAQILAVIMLSSAISSEIYHKTLDVLMTTPITSFQIVFGKVLSAMLQLVLLLSISFSLLGVVRVFGGIEWGYVLSTFCITITGCLFAASLSLFFSIKSKYAYSVIIKVVIFYFVVYGLFTFLVNVKIFSQLSGILALLNPFSAFHMLYMKSYPQFATAGVKYFSWPLHCIIMLAVSSGILTVSALKVRNSALNRLAPAAGVKKNKNKIRKRKASVTEMRYMVGADVFNGFDLSRKSRKTSVIIIVSAAAIVVINLLGLLGFETFFQFFISQILWIVATLRTGAMAAISIAKEKESNAFSILLTTPLTNKQIVYAKIRTAIRRNLALWLLLLLNTCMIIVTGFFENSFSGTNISFATPELLQHIPALFRIPAYILFVTGVGIFCGAKYKNQSSAVTSFLVSILVLYIFNSILVMLIFGVIGFLISFGSNDIYLMVLSLAMPILIYAVVGIVYINKTVKNLRQYVL